MNTENAMQTDVTLPELGENIKSATVLDVLVSAGQEVAKDQALLTLESDKAEFDLPSPVAGRIAEVLVERGAEVHVGQVILRLSGASQGASAGQQTLEQAAPRAPAGTRVAEPRRSGASADKRGVAEQVAPVAPVRAEPEPLPVRAADRAQATATYVAAPSVRRLARELGIDLASVPVTASSGRVSPEDVYRYVRSRLEHAAGDGRASTAAGEHDYSRWGATRTEPMTTVRRRTAEQMSLAWSSIPHVTHYDAADVTELERLRRQFAARVERAGGKLTITAILLKVLGSALRRFPKFNASVDMQSPAIVYKDFINVGVAVDTERGLLVPVIQHVDDKNIVELARELHDVSEAARSRKIRPEMLQGATFTVTNLGGIGGRQFSPLINPPEVAVLGVSRSAQEPIWSDGQFEPRLMLPLSLTYDHRVIDGADAARFLRWVCEALGEPFLMDLEGE